MLYDAYVRFFRWASDRLRGRDGIVCFVSDNSFIDHFAFDGMRHHLLQDFTHIYHLDLHGNVRRNPRLSGTTHNVFGIQVGVGITLAIRAAHQQERRLSYYRPFTSMYLYFDPLLNQRQGLWPRLLPTPASEEENRLICVPGPGNRKPFGCLAANHITDLDLAFEKIQCFPFYVYADDGSRQENITDGALALFQRHYGPQVSKWDLFHYVYAILHHPAYRERYAEQLKHELPRLPLLKRNEAFWAAVSLGRQLLDLHIHYERLDPYPLREIEDERFSYRANRRIERLRLSPDRHTIQVSPGLTLADVPEDCFRYVLGGRSALEWVLEQYQLRRDPHSGIVLDPNRPDDPDYIVRLLKQVVTVSLQTLTLMEELEQAITPEDWQVACPSA